MTRGAPSRVLIVDDHPVVRAGLASYLALHDDLDVVAEAGDLAAARRAAREHALDLVLLDLILPDGDGLELIAELRGLEPSPRVVVLTSALDETRVRRALAAGASGYLLKDAPPAALLDRLRAALRGEIPLDPAALRALAGASEPRGDDPLERLTPRELDVLEAIADGLANREIGERLGIAEKTVKTHATQVFAKLGVDGRTQAALRYRELRGG